MMTADPHICSFCGKNYPNTMDINDILLVACPSSSICTICIKLCMKIIEEYRQERILYLRSWEGMMDHAAYCASKSSRTRE